MNCGANQRAARQLDLQQRTRRCPGGATVSGGKFNRSTQHYLAGALRCGAGTIPPLRAKILDTTLVPRAPGRRRPPSGRSSSAPRAQPFALARTMFVHVPHMHTVPTCQIRRKGCCVDRLNPPANRRHSRRGRRIATARDRMILISVKSPGCRAGGNRTHAAKSAH